MGRDVDWGAVSAGLAWVKGRVEGWSGGGGQRWGFVWGPLAVRACCVPLVFCPCSRTSQGNKHKNMLSHKYLQLCRGCALHSCWGFWVQHTNLPQSAWELCFRLMAGWCSRCKEVSICCVEDHVVVFLCWCVCVTCSAESSQITKLWQGKKKLNT